jgi:hypothetical protein
VGEARFDGSETGRVERDWVWSPGEVEFPTGRVDVDGLESAEFAHAERVEEGEESDGGFVGVDVGVVVGPASEQAALLTNGERCSFEASFCLGGERGGRVDEHDSLFACPPEELAGGGESSPPVCGPVVEERIDVVGLDGRPVELGSCGGEEHRKVPDDGQVAFDCGIRAGLGSCLAGPFA